MIPRAQGVEIVGEVADLLIRCVGVRRVLCVAAHNVDKVCSVRTREDSDHAEHLLQKTLSGLGGGGGHEHRAGGKVPGIARGGRVTEDLEDEIRDRCLPDRSETRYTPRRA